MGPFWNCLIGGWLWLKIGWDPFGITLLGYGWLWLKNPGFPHGMLTTHAEVINPDILAFI
jgi:hypothetical protein